MTRRSELEPMSMTAIGGPWSSRPWAAPLASLAAVTPTREAARLVFLERLATARKTRIGHEEFLGVERLFARRRLYAHRRAIRQELPALLVVLEVGEHDLVEHLLVHRRVENRAQSLDPAVQ